MFKKVSLLLVFSLLLLMSVACATPATQVPASQAPAVVEATTAPTEVAPTAIPPTETPTVEVSTAANVVNGAGAYPIVDTNQGLCYDDSGVIDCPGRKRAFYGQDAQFTGNAPSYTDNGDGTITDNVTGLIWQKSPDTNGDGNITAADKIAYNKAAAYCDNLSFAGYDDWQLPTIKQLYSLIIFSGVDPSGYESTDTSGLIPFIDTDHFDFAYGDTSARERIIDSQYASSNFYVGNGEQFIFGVNFADGRIKGYGILLHGQDKTLFVSCIRQNSTYGVNAFVDNGDETITDNATGLMWAKNDSGSDAPDGLNWEAALAYVETQNAANYLGYSDWRLPNIKELHSIMDYSRSPDTTNSAAIDPVFNATPITNEAGQTDYSFYWSGTTHSNWTANPGSAGAYVSFGRAMGYMDGVWKDVHGAGAQRSDPKSGDPADYPEGNGPQGDAQRIYNAVRLVRGGDVTETPAGDPTAADNGQVALVGTSGSAQEQPGDQQPDLAAAATALGITEEALKAALGDPSQGPPDFAAAAQALGVTEADLLAALGAPADGQPPAGNQPPASGTQSTASGNQPPGGPGGQRPDLATAAAQLGVTEAALQAALGDPSQGPPDFAAAAQTLGVTESDLMAALGASAGGQPPAGGPPSGGRPLIN